ncbi:alpha/beta hydrolase family protein [Labilibaculum euxinus]
MIIFLFLGGCVARKHSVTDAQTAETTADSVHFCNADSSICFGGTLLIPQTEKPNPVVIFVSGSGKQDRDGTMAGHKMFKTIADYLAQNGIASLRIDDRGVGETGGIYEESTTADFAADVLTAINYLKSRKDIDSKHIGLIGHSEGGAVISIAATQSSDVAFLVSLAGLASEGLDALKKQNRDLVEQSELPDYDKKRSNEINGLMFESAYRYADSDSMEYKSHSTYDE